MKNLKISIIATIAIIFLSTLALNAKQNRNPHNDRKCGFENLNLTQEMSDKLNKIKSDFDAKLTPEELNTLNQLREKVKNERQDIASQIKNIKSSSLSKDEKKSKIKELLESNKGNRDDVRSTLKPILDNNKDAVKNLTVSLKELAPNNEKCSKGKGKMKEEQKIVRFILHPEFYATKDDFKSLIENSNKLDITVDQSNLNFESKSESTNSNCTLYDMNGNKIAQLNNQQIQTGKNTLDINLFGNNIQKGRYFLMIENENDVSAGKFIYLK